MLRARLLAVFIALLPAGSALGGPQAQAAQAFPPGTAIARVATLESPQQSYALYLPSRYSPAERWPMVYVFDPLARGPFAIAQFQHAAELYGYLIAASNNSRNGPWQPEFDAAEAMVRDTQQRFSVDLKRIYFAGFSGGARVAAQLAQRCKCSAGVLLSGAGFPHGSSPSSEVRFPVFSAVGNADFNYRELLPLQDTLLKADFPHWLRVFDGPHEWAPPGVIDEALAWFRLESMKSQREGRDENWVGAQLEAAKQRASALEQSGAVLAAYREYQQIAQTFDAHLDGAAFRAKAAALEAEKPLRDALKRERADFDEQDRLSDEVLSAAEPARTSEGSPSYRGNAGALARDLRLRAEHEKRFERALVFKRSLSGVFIGSVESANEALDKKDYARAAQLFACATEANPGSEWSFRNLAVARALSGDKKGTLEALRSARKLSQDPPAFADWIKKEPAFARWNPHKDFQALSNEVGENLQNLRRP